MGIFSIPKGVMCISSGRYDLYTHVYDLQSDSHGHVLYAQG